MTNIEWLLFLTQLPATPSSLRVAVWRRLKEAGAATLQNGVWILPNSTENNLFLGRLLAFIKHNAANAQIFVTHGLNQSIQDDIISHFNRDRDEQYSEFIEQSKALIGEVEKECLNEKFTYAELEENEENLRRLQKWLLKIQKRDFFSSTLSTEATQMYQKAKQLLQQYTRWVYEQEGINITEQQSQNHD